MSAISIYKCYQSSFHQILLTLLYRPNICLLDSRFLMLDDPVIERLIVFIFIDEEGNLELSE